MRFSAWLLVLGVVAWNGGSRDPSCFVLAQKDDRQDPAEDVNLDVDNNSPGDAANPIEADVTTPNITDTSCPGLDLDSDCEECLTAGCVMTLGQCLINCDSVADAPCWSTQYINATEADICEMMQADEEDNTICGANRLNSCQECTSTLKSDDSTPCSWYESPDGGYCGAGGCDMMGSCPVESCDDTGNVTAIAADALDPVLVEEPAVGLEPPTNASTTTTTNEAPVEPPVEVQGEVEVTANVSTPNVTKPGGGGGGDGPGGAVTDKEACETIMECEACLNDRPDCAWSVGRCMTGCMVADAACYTQQAFPDKVALEICELANNSTSNEPVLGPDEEEEEGGPCTGLPDCEPCLNSRMDCAWVEDLCQSPSKCTAVAPDECFYPANYPNMTGPEICAIADEQGNVSSTTDSDGDSSTTDAEVSKNVSWAVSQGRFLVLPITVSLMALMVL